VNTRTQLPQRSILITSVILVLLGLINIGSTAAFNAILSLSVLGIQISYAVPVALMLWRRLSSGKVILPYGPWKLGCYGVAINAISMVYLIYTSIFMVFPANQPVTALNMNYSSLVFGAVLIASCIYWVWKGTKQYDGPNIVIRPTA
jgi:choline transport protein